jgi:hypothetical protein
VMAMSVNRRIERFSYTHFTSRPAVETVLTDAEGHGYTAFHEVPGQRADPQIHVHNALLKTCPRSAMTWASSTLCEQLALTYASG